jgi:hypothetical protein
VVQVLPTFFAYREDDAIRWWQPPLGATFVSSEGDEQARPFAEELVKDIVAGGLPARAVKSFSSARDTVFAAGMPLLGTLELAGWDYDAWSRDKALRSLASRGMREGVQAMVPSVWAARLVGLAPELLLSTLLKAAPTLGGQNVREMWRVHGPKIAGQTRHLLDTIIERGNRRASSTESLKELRRRLG